MSDGKRIGRKVNPALLLRQQKPNSLGADKSGVETGEFLPAARAMNPKNNSDVVAEGKQVNPSGRLLPNPLASTGRPQDLPVEEKPVSSSKPVEVGSHGRRINPRFADAPAESSAVKRSTPSFPSVHPQTRGPQFEGGQKESESVGEAEVEETGDSRQRLLKSIYGSESETRSLGSVKDRVGDDGVSEGSNRLDEETGEVVRPDFLSARAKKTIAKNGNLKRGTQSPANRRPAAHVESDGWSADDSTDTSYGLGGEKETYSGKADYAKALRMSDRDLILIKFLVRYRYAYTEQLARLVDSTPSAVKQRLRKLEERGLVRRQHLTDRQYLWMTRKAGNLLAGSSFGEIKKGTVSFATIAHTIGLANLGVELERENGGKDILGERLTDDELPAKNRYKFGIWDHEDGKGFGEMTVTEREVRQGQLRWRGGKSTQEMRELVDLAVEHYSEPQELLEGNEGLFVVYGANGVDGEHIPDLVVARERGDNGAPKHIAVELELTGKPLPQWRRILRWYRDNGVMYDKVYYFTHKRSIATALQRADEEVGLGDRLIIRKYVPVNGRVPFWG